MRDKNGEGTYMRWKDDGRTYCFWEGMIFFGERTKRVEKKENWRGMEEENIRRKKWGRTSREKISCCRNKFRKKRMGNILYSRRGKK